MNVQEQEAPHNAKIFVKAIHAGDSVRTRYCPIAVPDERSAQRVKKHKQSRRTRERANSDRERNRKLHERRYGSSQYWHRNAKLHDLTYRARIVPQLSVAENQEQCREKKTGRKSELIVDAVYHKATLAPHFLVGATANWRMI